MRLPHFFALAAIAGLFGCSHGARPSRTAPFESSLPPLATRFGDLAEKASSKDACADLAATATFAFTETPDGGAVVLTPRGGHSRSDVIEAATRVEQTFLPGVLADERASCRIFTKSDEVTVRLQDGGDGLRLVFETFESQKAPGVKERVKAFAEGHAR
jgi:hypothetical protein